LKLNPEMLLARYHLGKVQLQRGRDEEATATLSRVVETAPDFRPALEALGQALLKQQQAERAVAVLERAVKLGRDWPDGHVLLGRAYMAAGRREDARREFAIARQLGEAERKRLEEKVAAPPPQP
jgi:Flp pilus assembly protein TadD